jgi:hypothetical protein
MKDQRITGHQALFRRFVKSSAMALSPKRDSIEKQTF